MSTPAVITVSASKGARKPPVVFIHGAANSALVWRFWQQALAGHGWTSHAVDLRGHGATEGDLAVASMHDYERDVASVIDGLHAPPVVFGWSMGGLVAMMVAAKGKASACVALAPSTPAMVVDGTVQLRQGVFGPVEYGITSENPDDQVVMPDLDREERQVALSSLCLESRLARDERRAGIVIKSLPCPLLIVTGSLDKAWPRSAYSGLWLAADSIELDGASHWGLVLNRRILPSLIGEILSWLQRMSRPQPTL